MRARRDDRGDTIPTAARFNGQMTSNLMARLRADLTAAQFTVSRVSALWGDEADAALRRGHRMPAQRALAARLNSRTTSSWSGTEVAVTLAELFILGLPVSRAAAEIALPQLGLDGALELGLVASDDSADGEPSVRPLLDLRPYSFIDTVGAGSWWILSDLGELALGHALGENHVLGVGGASMTLSGLVMPRRVDTALDLGTGCGIQAMHVARHARHVVATDISQPALRLARLNAELNGIDNIEFRLGSLYEPVAGERFDHIISNPPFVITPRVEGVPSYEYRDGGMTGDDLVAGVLRDAVDHLTPGGVAQMLGNWEYHRETDAFDRLRGWLDETGLDYWITERDVQDPAEYAETWIRDGGTRHGTGEFDALYAAWLGDFEARGVTRVGFGYVTLRLPASPATARPLRRIERLHGPLGGSAAGLGEHLAACLSARDWQSALTDDQLAAAIVVHAPDVTEERHYWPGADDPTAMLLRQGQGFGRTVTLDTPLAALVGACDGDLTVGAICGALAQLLEADETALQDELLKAVRGLIDDGFLVHAG